MSETYFKDDLVRLSRNILITTLLFYLPILIFSSVPDIINIEPFLDRGGVWSILSFIIGFIVFISFVFGLIFVKPNGARRFITLKFHLISFLSKLVFFIIIEGTYGLTFQVNPIYFFGFFIISLVFDGIALMISKNVKEEKLKKKIVKANGLLNDSSLRRYKKATRFSFNLGIAILLLSFRHQVAEQTTIFFMALVFIYSMHIYKIIFKSLKLPQWRRIVHYSWSTLMIIGIISFRYFTSIPILETTSLLILINSLIYFPVIIPLMWMSFRIMWHYDFALAKGLITRPL